MTSKTGKQAVCARLWRADACAQGVPVARTAGGPYVYGSMGILKSTRCKVTGAGKEHSSAVRGGGRDPGVRRPGSGLGRPTVRSKFFRADVTVIGTGREQTRVQARRLRTPVHTTCSIVVIGLHLTALPPPDSSAAAPRVPKNKNSEVARRHPDGLGTEHNTQSFSGC